MKNKHTNKFDKEYLAKLEAEYNDSRKVPDSDDILDAIEELADKVWYNRHLCRMWKIENGEIEVIPKGTERYGNNVMYEHILEGAMKSARKVEEKYDDTGPWSDFEWGMINGKLSALRWIIGEGWDNLYG